MTDTDAEGFEETVEQITERLAAVSERLTEQRDALAEQLAQVEAQLTRVEASRAALTGQPPTKAPGGPQTSQRGTKRAQSQRSRDKVLAIARRIDQPFVAGDIAPQIGMSTQGIGPIMAALVRDGEFTVVDNDGTRRSYRLANAA